MTWHLPEPHADVYRHKDGRELPRLSTVLDLHADFRIDGRIPVNVLMAAADVGTVAHAGIAMRYGHKPDLGSLPDLDDRQQLQAQAAGDSWLAWHTDRGEPEAEAVEVTLEGDGYVCTADWIGIVNGRRWLIDWKTSTALSQGRGCVQLAGQLAAWERHNRERPIDVCALVRLDKRAPGTWEECVWDVEQMRGPRAVLGALVAISRVTLPQGVTW